VTEVCLFTDSQRFEVSGRTFKTKLNVWYSGVQRAETGGTDVTPLFTLVETKDVFQRLVGNWLAVSHDLDSVCELFFAPLYASDVYLEHRFISFVQALESYHRRRPEKFRTKQVADEEFVSRIEKVTSPLTDRKLATWLRKKLRHANEVGLPDRLEELMSLTATIIPRRVRDQDAFIRKAADTRNYLTHYDPDRRAGTANDDEMEFMTVVMEAIIAACLLLELGFEPGQCNEYLHRDLQKVRRYEFYDMI